MTPEQEVEEALGGPWFHIWTPEPNGPFAPLCGINEIIEGRSISWPYCPKCFAIRYPLDVYRP